MASGVRVALALESTAPHLAAAFGVWRAGGVLVPLDPRLRPSEAEAIVGRARAAFLLRVDGATGERRLEALASPVAADGERPPCSDDVAVVASTSGTTGEPKGVLLSHANLLWAATAVARTRGDRPQSVAAVLSPISHTPVFVSHFLARLLSGGTVVLARFDAERVAELLREHGVTDLPLVPAMVEPLLGSDVRARLETITIGSATTSMEAKRALAERFPGARIVEAYGQTESTDGLTMTTGREALERPGTVGRAHALLAVAVRGRGGHLCGPGETGEVVARGPTVMRGYDGDPAATADALRDGWLHTGDLGALDEDGFLFLRGRLREVIRSGGETVSPSEVEAVLARHPAVIEVAVFGVPDPRWGERVAAAVVARAPLSEEDLREFARPHLAPFKLPRALLRLERLPRTAAGKVRRSELRVALERYASGSS